MLSPLFWLTAGLAAVDWAAVSRTSAPDLLTRLRWITKPAVLIALIAWYSQQGGWQNGAAWFGVGLVFSLLGDVLLLLPDRFFLAGAGAFLLAHLAYIGGLCLGMPLPPWQILVAAVPAAAAFATIRGRLRAGLQAKGQIDQYLPVSIYALVLSTMWAAALSTLLRPDWEANPALVVAIGGTLFFVSDTLLAYDRFIQPIRYGALLVMVTYHSGQVLLAAGALLHWLF
jgi:uncharacterized membrane protein YhhN